MGQYVQNTIKSRGSPLKFETDVVSDDSWHCVCRAQSDLVFHLSHDAASLKFGTRGP